MRWALETWDPDYGSTNDETALADASAAVDINVEVDTDDWAPRDPGEFPEPDELLFVDGIRRIEGRVWITTDDGIRQGIVASYAAGLVRCNGAASVVDAQVERALFCEGHDLDPIVTQHGTFEVRPVAPGSPDALSLALQGAMADLEARVALDAGTTGVIVVDGPLRERRHLPNAIGYVKTHHVGYLPPLVADTVAALADGQRTPLFTIGDRFARISWYQRLPGPRSHGWAGIVRGEVGPDVPLERAVELADLATAMLPRFASAPHKDPRAPQNLYPIAGLERALRRRLGDRALIQRALRVSAGRPGSGQGEGAASA